MDLKKEEDQSEFLKHVEVIKPGKVSFSKPIAIIYNPTSGKKRDIRAIIRQRLEAA